MSKPLDNIPAKRKPAQPNPSGSVKHPAGHRPGAKLPEFSRSLPMALMRGREAVMRYFRPSLREHDVTEQQWRVLRALAYRGAIEVTELANITLLLAPSLSRILRDLDKRGLIERKSVKTDLRRNVVSISTSGRHLIRVVAPESEAAYAEIRKRFGERRLGALQRMLRELETILLAGLPEEADFAGNDPEPARRGRKHS